MTKALTVNITKLILIAITGFILLFFIVNKAFAQSPSPQASAAPAANFTFPIKDLGGCSDLGTCTKYCEDPVNYNSCSDYAKKNGSYKDDRTT